MSASYWCRRCNSWHPKTTVCVNRWWREFKVRLSSEEYAEYLKDPVGFLEEYRRKQGNQRVFA